MSNSKWRRPAGAVAPAIDPSIPVKEPAPAARSSLSDQEVIDILDLGAKFIHTFLVQATQTLAGVGVEKLRQVACDEPEPAHESPQQRPRGRAHPLMLLVKFGVSATGLIQRIFRVTHPHLFPGGGERRERVASAAEKFVKMVGKAMPSTA